MNSIEKRRQNDLAGLLFVHHFGWLRAIELGALLFPKNATSAEAANRIVRSWEKRRLVIVRELPERAGKAVVLATAGVRFLSENGHKSSSGKDLGSIGPEGWRPPASWRHDLIATGLLVALRKRGYSVIPEAALRRLPTDSTKLPDGLAKAPRSDVWICRSGTRTQERKEPGSAWPSTDVCRPRRNQNGGRRELFSSDGRLR